MVELLGVLAIGGGVAILLRVLNVFGPGGGAAGGGNASGGLVYDAVAAQVAQGIPVKHVQHNPTTGETSATFAVNNVDPADPTLVHLANAMRAGTGPRPE